MNGVLAFVGFMSGVSAVAFLPFWIKPAVSLFVRPQPLVLLVCDMLRVAIGWTDGGNTLVHQTGVNLYLSFRTAGAQKYYKLSIDGAEVRLNEGDRYRLRRALRFYDKRHSDVENERAARILADKAKQFADRARSHADNVVKIRAAR